MNEIIPLRDNYNLLITQYKLQWVPISFTIPNDPEQIPFIKTDKEIPIYNVHCITRKRDYPLTLFIYYGYRNGSKGAFPREIVRFDNEINCEKVFQYLLEQNTGLQLFSNTGERNGLWCVIAIAGLTLLYMLGDLYTQDISTFRSLNQKSLISIIALTLTVICIWILKNEKNKESYADDSYR